MPGHIPHLHKAFGRPHDTTTVHWVVLLALFAALVAAILENTVWSGNNWLAGVNNAVIFGTPTLALAFVLLRRNTTTHYVSSSNADKEQIGQNNSVDIITDEIAQQISWLPTRSHTNGEARNCKISNDSNAEYLRFDPIFIYRYIGLVLIPVIMAGLSWIHFFGAQENTGVALVPASHRTLVYFLGFAVVAAWLNDLRKHVPAAIFDKTRRVFWIEKRHVLGNKSGESAQMPIAQIHALQIISYTGYEAFQQQKAQQQNSGIADDPTPTIQSKDRLVNEYEVNVVFKNLTRVNILNHRNKRAIKKDARALADFLDVPLWDRDTLAAFVAR